MVQSVRIGLGVGRYADHPITNGSVGTYHASSLLVASRPPTAGVLSRGIGMEGISSILAGLWGTGVGSTTLTENVHTIAVTKMGSRRAVELGAVILILLSFVGKVGGFIASIPDVMVAGLLCFMWAMLAALGLSNLRYSETGSSRNSIILILANLSKSRSRDLKKLAYSRTSECVVLSLSFGSNEMRLVSTGAGDEHKRDTEREARVVENDGATAPLMWVGNTVVIAVLRLVERRENEEESLVNGRQRNTDHGQQQGEYESMQRSTASHY
ncbi:hypothetical protein GW17_00052523 [Ensete ventricosum]|nr:hypothetical protein GW17_00052523 [Ensete ventricosum]